MKKAIKTIMQFLIWSRLWLIKIHKRSKSFRFSRYNHLGRHVIIHIDRKSNVLFGREFALRDNAILSVRNGAEFKTGEEVFFNSGCQITVHNQMIFGNRGKVGSNTMFFDHDHDYKADGGVSARKYINGSIIIGDDCWIGAGCIILKNTVLGKNSVVAAGSVVFGNYPDNSFIVQKKTTSVSTIER